MPLTSAIFDLDGLLVDTEPVCYQMNRELLRPYGKDIALADYARYFSGGTLHFNLQQLIDRYELPVSFEEMRITQRKVMSRLPFDKVEAKPGAQEVLLWLDERGIKRCLATATTPRPGKRHTFQRWVAQPV